MTFNDLEILSGYSFSKLTDVEASNSRKYILAVTQRPVLIALRGSECLELSTGPAYSCFPWCWCAMPFVRGFWATVCKTVRPMLSHRCLSCADCLSCPVCDVGALWPNGWMDRDETWHAGRPRPWPHCVRRGPSSACPKREQPPPDFRPIAVVAKWRDGSRCHLVRR